MKSAFEEKVQSLLKRISGRVTQPRRDVLAVLMNAMEPLTHSELQNRLPDHDRVTLYRVLDWLVENALIESLAGEDGVRRYIAHDPAEHAHPHFKCKKCGSTRCLHGVTVKSSKLPPGYEVGRVSTMISGICASCNQAR